MPRGGARGGGFRGGRPKPGRTRIAGFDIEYDDDLETHINAAGKPTDLYPVTSILARVGLFAHDALESKTTFHQASESDRKTSSCQVSCLKR
jgi:hypothetical protein